tara:strand:- start:3512 stop:5437 length:1926 start_codon:yes stop_codon:yes gene_type:complete
MAEIKKSLLQNSSSIETIQQSINSFGASIRKANTVSSSVIRQLYAGNREKKRSILAKSQLIQKRKEAARRREREDVVEAGKVGSIYKRAGTVIQNSTKGLLGRIMDFAGAILVGWMVNNLPRIIKGAQQLIERVDTVVKTLSGWFNNLTSFFGLFGSDLDSTLSRIKGVSPEVEAKELDKAVDKTRSGVIRADQQFKQMIEDLNNFDLLKVLGLRGAPESKDNRGDRPPSRSDAGLDSGGGFSEPDSGTSGGRVSDRQVYQYLRSKGVSHIHALGITANVLGESDFEIAADEAGDGSQGIGLFQYTFPSRKQAFLQAVPDYKTNWKAQVEFAIGEGSAPQYLSTEFSSPEQAAEWWMNNWERPAEYAKPGRRKKHNNWIANFKPPQADKKPATSSVSPVSSGPVNIDAGKTISVDARVGDTIKTSNYGMRWGRKHGGIDLGCPIGTYISCRLPCRVVEARYENGYGYYTDIIIPSLNIRLRFAHLSSQLIKSGEVPAMTPFARSGNSGAKTTGPHIHMEATRNLGGTAYGGELNPDPYTDAMVFSKNPPVGGSQPGLLKQVQGIFGLGGPSLDPVKTQTNVAQNVTPEKNARTIPVPIPDMGGEAPAPSGGGGGGIKMIGTSGNQLNTFVTKTLLRELEYT